MPAIGFRRLHIDDLQQVFLWLLQPHVAKWYAPAPSSFMEAVAKYGPRTQPGSPVDAFIVEVEGRGVGYAQAYAIDAFPDYALALECGPGAAGIDLFIGEETVAHRGLGAQIVRQFVDEVVFAKDAVRACLADPSEGDHASIRAFEKAGFRRWKTVRMPEAEPKCVLRRERGDGELRLAPIDLARDASLCAAFRRESYLATYGTHEGLEAEMGEGDALYLAQLAERVAQVPEGNAILWQGERAVGQTEMRLVAGDATVGYVNLFYVVPDLRRRGLGRLLHDHAVAVFRARGMRRLRLSVSRRNATAIAFYRSLGWSVVGTRPDREAMEIMEIAIG